MCNSATKDGKLYHGRVLDYMTTIGLQDAATTFIVKPEGYLSFANVGYAAFIGSVSGMNTKAISLGEMGGKGEGHWDGVPMATLMRRALEECSTLEEVMQLWTESPRTCEYYYVFADGKTNEAVGVAAYPESIEFIKPGQSHERSCPFSHRLRFSVFFVRERAASDHEGDAFCFGGGKFSFMASSSS